MIINRNLFISTLQSRTPYNCYVRFVSPATGIGVDDTFVICQNLDQLPDHMDDFSVKERISHALKRAGVSITVTSLTDIVAFGVGAVTVSRLMNI